MDRNAKRYVLLLIVCMAGFSAYFAIRPLFPTYWPLLLVGIALLMRLALSAMGIKK
jgi:hypothetical protein